MNEQQQLALNEDFLRTYLRDTLSLNESDQLQLDQDSELIAQLQHEVLRQAKASAQAGLEAAEARRLAHEYDQEAARVREVLEACCLPLDALSSKARLAVRLTAQVCSELGLSRPDVCGAAAAWAQLLLRGSRAAQLEAQLDLRLAALQRAERSAVAKHRQLLRVDAAVAASQASAAAAAARPDRLGASGLAAKEAEYTAKAAPHLARVAAAGVSPALQHGGLEEMAGELAALSQLAEARRAALAAYHGLPTSALAASVRLQELQRRLAQVQEQLESGIAQLG